jgi:hypothetical protein
VAPDVFVVREPLPKPDPRVYLTWEDPPVIFVAEIGSRSTFRADEGPKLEIYSQNVRAPEYIYADPPRGDIRMWRLGPTGYDPAAAEANGRLRSVELGLEFGLEADGFLRVYTPDGERLRTHEEAEQRLAEEVQRRQEAEARAAEEAARRAELERQLAALQARQKRKR